MHGSAVTRSTLRQQIADALRDEVLAGRLEPGQEFTVKEIADQYGVSATPVREALVDLSAQGLLDSVQHRGFRVHEFSLTDLRGMIEARSLVTESIFRSLDDPRFSALAGTATAGTSPGPGSSTGTGPSVRAGTPGLTEVLDVVRRRGEEAQRAARAGDLTVLVGYDLRFWREISALFGNPYLSDFLHRLRVQSWVCAVGYLRRVDDLEGCLWSGHTELVDALMRRDRTAAEAIIVSYNAHALDLIERLAAG